MCTESIIPLGTEARYFLKKTKLVFFDGSIPIDSNLFGLSISD